MYVRVELFEGPNALANPRALATWELCFMIGGESLDGPVSRVERRISARLIRRSATLSGSK
jgi:hypothetical protein